MTRKTPPTDAPHPFGATDAGVERTFRLAGRDRHRHGARHPVPLLEPGLLATFRRSLGYTQDQMAVLLGMTSSHYAHLERGRHRPRHPNLLRWALVGIAQAHAVGVPVDQAFSTMLGKFDLSRAPEALVPEDRKPRGND